MDDPALRDELVQLRTQVQQMRSAVDDLRTVLIGQSGAAAERAGDADMTRVIQEGARAFSAGMSTSPYREASREETWWRLGWQIAKDAVKNAKRTW